jgi:hypothetical protein
MSDRAELLQETHAAVRYGLRGKPDRLFVVDILTAFDRLVEEETLVLASDQVGLGCDDVVSQTPY